MPFIQVAGDQPDYTLKMKVQNEKNLREFDDILPVLGAFHSHNGIYGSYALKV